MTAIIFLSQLVLGYIAWLLVFAAYILPRFRTMPRLEVQRAIATVHGFRFFGLVFLVPGVVGPHLPSSFAVSAAWGDFTTGCLAILALMTFRIRPLFWVCVVAYTLTGIADLVVNYAHASQAGVPDMAGELGATYIIPVLYVPILMITHVTAVYWLMRPRSKAGPDEKIA